jgi:hypothetical protein
MGKREGSLVWHGDAFRTSFREVVYRRFNECAFYLLNKAKDNVSVPAPPPSAPGEFPHMDQKTLHDSMYVKVDRFSLLLTLGNTAVHALPLELGTMHMAPRSFLRRTLYEERMALRSIILKRVTNMRGGFLLK